MNPNNILVQYVITEDNLNWMVTQVKSKGAGSPGYQTVPKDSDKPPGTTGIIHIGHDQGFWTYDYQVCQGTNQLNGYCTYLTMAVKLWDHFCWIPFRRTVHQFYPIVILATWFGVVYVVNFIYIAMDIAKKQ